MRLPAFTAEAALCRPGQPYTTHGLFRAGRPEIQPQRIKLPDACDSICGGNVACALACRLKIASLLPIIYGDLYF